MDAFEIHINLANFSPSPGEESVTPKFYVAVDFATFVSKILEI